jgi:hypothetical protein
MLPSAITTSMLRTFSRIVPYKTALVPDALVAHMPQMEASAVEEEGMGLAVKQRVRL